jgi:hypothetical protein
MTGEKRQAATGQQLEPQGERQAGELRGFICSVAQLMRRKNTFPPLRGRPGAEPEDA